MRFLLLLTQIESEWERAPAGAAQQVVEQYAALERELRAQKKFIESLRLRSCSEAVTLRNRPRGERLIEKGPFVDADEAIGGLYLLDCASMQEAVEWAKRMPDYGHGSIEVRPVWELDGPREADSGIELGPNRDEASTGTSRKGT